MPRVLGMFLPVVICLVAAFSLDGIGVNNGFLVGAFLSAALLSRMRSPMKEIPGSVTFLQISIGLSVGISIAVNQHGTSFDAALTVRIAIAASLALILQWFLAVSVLRASGWSWIDSVLSAYPGAMAAVLELTEKNRASDRVLFVHVLRLLLIAVAAIAVPPAGATGAHGVISDYPIGLYPAFLISILISYAAGRLFRLLHVPAPYMLAAIVVGLIATGTLNLGLLAVPGWAVRASEVFLAIAVMGRLRGISFAEVRACAGGIALLFLTMVVSVAGFGLAAAHLLGIDLFSAVLGLQPGGIETVAIVAVGAGLNVGLIMQMHLVRLAVVHILPATVQLGKNEYVRRMLDRVRS